MAMPRGFLARAVFAVQQVPSFAVARTDSQRKEQGTPLTPPLLFLIQIFAGNVILRHFVSANFLFVGPVGGFDARHYSGFERVSFLNQLVHTLRISACVLGQSLQTSRLPRRPRSYFFARKQLDIRTLALSLNAPPGSARRLRAGCFPAGSLRFHGRLFYCRLLRQLFLGGCLLLLNQLLFCCFLHRRPLRGSFLPLCLLLLLGFLGGHRRSLPPADGCSLAH